MDIQPLSGSSKDQANRSDASTYNKQGLEPTRTQPPVDLYVWSVGEEQFWNKPIRLFYLGKVASFSWGRG
jgi:hypothetical protein